MHKQRLTGMIAAGITFAGTLLPWATGVPVIENVSGTSFLGGWLVVLLVGFSIYLHLAGDDKTPLKSLAFIVGLLSGIVGISIAIIKIVSFNSEIQEMLRNNSQCPEWANQIHFGFGLYMVILGGIAQVLAAVFMRKKKE